MQGAKKGRAKSSLPFARQTCTPTNCHASTDGTPESNATSVQLTKAIQCPRRGGGWCPVVVQRSHAVQCREKAKGQKSRETSSSAKEAKDGQPAQALLVWLRRCSKPAEPNSKPSQARPSPAWHSFPLVLGQHKRSFNWLTQGRTRRRLISALASTWIFPSFLLRQARSATTQRRSCHQHLLLFRMSIQVGGSKRLPDPRVEEHGRCRKMVAIDCTVLLLDIPLF